jgi:hypothetical protein
MLRMMNSRSLHCASLRRDDNFVWALRFERENSGGTRGALQIPPLRFAPVGMTKGRGALSLKVDAADDEQQVPPLRFASVGMTILLGQSMTPERSLGCAHRFRPTYARANVGHPSIPFNFREGS